MRIGGWSGYQDFLSIARAGSISAAARKMGVAQPTLSRRLAMLEEDIAVRLLTRTPTGFRLTPAGERMLATLELVGDQLGQMEAEILDADVSLQGAVRVTVTETLGVTWLAPLVLEFNEAYPQIGIELVIDNGLVNLLGREAHIAVRLLRPTQGDLIARKAGRLEIALYAAHSYARRYGLPTNDEEAANHKAIGLLGSTPVALMTAALFPPERHVMQSNSLMAVSNAVRAGLGIGPIVTLLGDNMENLVPCLPDQHRLSKDIWLTAVPELRNTARIRAVFDFLSERLSDLRSYVPPPLI
ncbi:LysR family transcriptional regulator [Halomonas halocynthiae]|uniref:LysR family transcriptional regulator n=1 Tax=Halomonas halocynthiae TaxID=176290 RepID=UPI0004274E09|nr:LysR family transcriptional regulator [Halomonas halocynthiae]